MVARYFADFSVTTDVSFWSPGAETVSAWLSGLTLSSSAGM